MIHYEVNERGVFVRVSPRDHARQMCFPKNLHDKVLHLAYYSHGIIWIPPVRCWSVAERGVLGSGKLQHHQPLSRVADMTPVNGRIELRPRKGEGSLGVHFLQAVERPICGARASSLQGVTRPGRLPLSPH